MGTVECQHWYRGGAGRERAIIIIRALAECELGGGAHTINPPPPFSPPYLASMWEHQDYKNYRNSLMAHTLYYHNYIEELWLGCYVDWHYYRVGESIYVILWLFSWCDQTLMDNCQYPTTNTTTTTTEESIPPWCRQPQSENSSSPTFSVWATARNIWEKFLSILCNSGSWCLVGAGLH